MATKREIEVRGPDVEAAISKGLAQLGLTRNDVIVEVLDEGSRGLLGIGARDAVVRLTGMMAASPPPARPKPAPEPKPQPVTPPRAAPTPTATPAPEPVPPTAVSPTPAQPVFTKPEPADIDDPDLNQDAETAGEVLGTILEHMGIEAEVVATLPEADDKTGRQMVTMQIVSDEDLSILIGPRGDTLGDLQYLTRLIAGNKLLRRTNITIDVQGYRQRREQALTRLAQRMAEKAVNRGHAVSLEPMPPNERRIIHMALRDYDGVYTNSVGEGSQRRVRIYLEE
jgi:spoIIIJ-associated protein